MYGTHRRFTVGFQLLGGQSCNLATCIDDGSNARLASWALRVGGGPSERRERGRTDDGARNRRFSITDWRTKTGSTYYPRGAQKRCHANCLVWCCHNTCALVHAQSQCTTESRMTCQALEDRPRVQELGIAKSSFLDILFCRVDVVLDSVLNVE